MHTYCTRFYLPFSGVGVLMTEPLYDAPSLSGVCLDLVFPQNLPSIVCSAVLAPQPGEMILDMCAAPGGKTTHIATLMNNKVCLFLYSQDEDFGASSFCLSVVNFNIHYNFRTVWHSCATNDTLSNDTKVNDLVTLTLTFVLKQKKLFQTLLLPGV